MGTGAASTRAYAPPVAVVACAALRDAMSRAHSMKAGRSTFLDHGLHLNPRRMRVAIQERLDALPVASLVLIGYGLCGNGLHELKSRHHTLIIPRVDDCISLFFGSRAEYLRAFREDAATYYLTPGWLECGGEPRSEFQKYCSRYGPERAARISDAMYGKYRKACFLACTAEALRQYRPRAREVADFCRQRWGWHYEEREGSDTLIRRLLEFETDPGSAAATARKMDEFVVIDPGGEVRQEFFLANPVNLGEDCDSCTTCTTK